MTTNTLSLTDLGLAGLLLLVNAMLSWGFRLNLERSLALATARMIVQLGAVGFVLKFVFEHGTAWLTGVLALIMVLIAAWETMARQEHRFTNRWQHWGLGTATLLFAGAVGTLYATQAVIGTEPWWSPRILLPILGMVLGNALTGISLVLDTLTAAAKRERGAIEARLALGHGRYDAFRDVLTRALRSGLMPLLNTMAIAGVVALPGMMTGQILTGADPVEAAKYQIMIMFVLSGATALAVVFAGIGGVWMLTDNRHRLRLERLETIATDEKNTRLRGTGLSGE